MAHTECFESMYDMRLKPRFLYEVMASHFPPEKQPSSNPLELSAAVSIIRRQKLLYELNRDEGLKVAVDAWIERILSYVNSKMPDKCWAGICILGVTCQECSCQRFLESYCSWFQNLIVHLKVPSESPFLRVAACASLSDLLTRLGQFPSAKKEGTSLAGKLVQTVLQLLGEDDSEALWNNVADLLCTILKCFPSSLHLQYNNAESVLVSKIMFGKCSVRISQKFARCLAFLPKAQSDGDSWYSMMQRVLLAINAHLNNAFQGFEDVTQVNDAIVPLLPPGKEPPPPLGGPSVEAESVELARKKFWQVLVPRVSSLLHCCCMMLTNPYPVQVTVPLGPLLALVSRILSVNGSLNQEPVPICVNTQQQALLCTQLPALHSCALDLLSAIVKGVRSQLLPRAANVVRLLTEYFRRCVSPTLRIKLYSNAQSLLISMGVGMASYIAPAIIYNAIADLKGSNSGAIFNSPNTIGQTNSTIATGGGDPVTNPRKRKSIHGLSAESSVSCGLERQLYTSDSLTSVSVQISALKALEALLTVGGSLRSDRWRAEVDLLLVTVAMNASTNSSFLQFCDEEDVSYFDESSSITTADFQLAAYKALLASLLSPCCHRPPYLSQGLALFRKGRQESGTELAEFCAHALLALEPLIHPRSLPYGATPAAMATNITSNIQKSSMFVPNSDSDPSILGASGNMAFGSSIKIGQHSFQFGEDDFYRDDEIYLGWLGNGEDSIADQNQLYENSEMPIESLVETLTANGDLQCAAIDEMENLASVQHPINGDVHPIPMEGPKSPSSDPNVVTFPLDPVGTDIVEPMDMCETHHIKVDETQDALLTASGAEKNESTELSISEPIMLPIENTLCEAIVQTAGNNSTPARVENTMTIHTHRLSMEAVETASNVHESLQESEIRLKKEERPMKSISSTGDSDSDTIPDIVDGDPDTD